MTFTDESRDPNDDIVSWAWDFGDGSISTDASPIHEFAASGEYSVSLTVTDSEGNSHTTTQSVIVSTDEIELSLVRANKSRLGFIRVELSWQGSSADEVTIYRDGQAIESVSNTGKFRDFSRDLEATSYTYKVCQSSEICSNEITVNF